jgi:GGDEF domain-containing protein
MKAHPLNTNNKAVNDILRHDAGDEVLKKLKNTYEKKRR